MENQKSTQLFNICSNLLIYRVWKEQMPTNWVNFWFFIMKENWDLVQENQGSYGILDQYLCMSDIP